MIQWSKEYKFHTKNHNFLKSNTIPYYENITTKNSSMHKTFSTIKFHLYAYISLN